MPLTAITQVAGPAGEVGEVTGTVTGLNKPVRVLLDTGATSGNYASSRVIDVHNRVINTVCNGVDGLCTLT